MYKNVWLLKLGIKKMIKNNHFRWKKSKFRSKIVKFVIKFYRLLLENVSINRNVFFCNSTKNQTKYTILMNFSKMAWNIQKVQRIFSENVQIMNSENDRKQTFSFKKSKISIENCSTNWIFIENVLKIDLNVNFEMILSILKILTWVQVFTVIYGLTY